MRQDNHQATAWIPPARGLGRWLNKQSKRKRGHLQGCLQWAWLHYHPLASPPGYRNILSGGFMYMCWLSGLTQAPASTLHGSVG